MHPYKKELIESLYRGGIPISHFGDDIYLKVRWQGDTYTFDVRNLDVLKTLNVPLEERAYEPDFPAMNISNLSAHPIQMLATKNGEDVIVTLQYKLATDLCHKYHQFHIQYIQTLNALIQAITNTDESQEGWQSRLSGEVHGEMTQDPYEPNISYTTCIKL